MFDTTGKAAVTPTRKENTLRKLHRMNQALPHEETDRVPTIDFGRGGLTGHANSDYQTHNVYDPLTGQRLGHRVARFDHKFEEKEMVIWRID